ncbi:hypothetical protein CP973_10505 [Streptomyces albofaciens JCM 4342]|nr:hypothetical protein CP973_10505 [Streptomyces albofaciens JCM 4342]
MRRGRGGVGRGSTGRGARSAGGGSARGPPRSRTARRTARMPCRIAPALRTGSRPHSVPDHARYGTPLRVPVPPPYFRITPRAPPGSPRPPSGGRR